MGEEAENASTVLGELEKIGFRKSLHVESVQEIVRNGPMNIPERYVRSSKDSVLPHLSSEIPIIDQSLLAKGDDNELRKLDMACTEWGFFQLINHGILPEVLQKVKTVAANFFELPLEQQEKYSMTGGDIQGYGHLYVVSETQKLHWVDLYALLIYSTKFRDLRYWPSEPTAFTEAVQNYSMEANRVAKELFAALSVLMGMEKDDLWKFHNEVLQGLRVNYYPTCSDPDKVVGVSPHSDTSTLTVLLQDGDVMALQIRHCGSWVPVKPIPDALVLNVGDVLEVLSNGRYKSIEHRAMTNKSTTRISIASFICPQEDTEIEPIEPLKGKMNCHQHAPKYKRTRYGEYLKHAMKREMDGKSHTQLVKLDTE